MSEDRIGWFERLISDVLRTGVAASLLLVVAGTIVSFVRHPDYMSSATELRRLTAPGAAFPHTVNDVVRGVRSGRGQAIVTVGLLLLVATPVLRVAVSIVAFALQRDRIYAIISAVVLAILLLSFMLGKAGA